MAYPTTMTDRDRAADRDWRGEQERGGTAPLHTTTRATRRRRRACAEDSNNRFFLEVKQQGLLGFSSVVIAFTIINQS